MAGVPQPRRSAYVETPEARSRRRSSSGSQAGGHQSVSDFVLLCLSPTFCPMPSAPCQGPWPGRMDLSPSFSPLFPVGGGRTTTSRLSEEVVDPGSGWWLRVFSPEEQNPSCRGGYLSGPKTDTRHVLHRYV